MYNTFLLIIRQIEKVYFLKVEGVPQNYRLNKTDKEKMNKLTK